MQNRRRFMQGVPALAFAALTVPRAFAQDAWPSRPIRLIVPSNPGSGSDQLTRAFGQYLQEQVKQSVVTDNKPGANTIIGAEATKQAAPDGYTFFCSSASSHSASPALFKKLPYDPAKDFTEVATFGIFPYVVVVRKDSPFRTVGELIDAAKAKPGQVKSGYSGSSSLVPLELLKAKAGIDIITASYRGAPQVVTDVAGGQIDFAILASVSGGPSANNGLLRSIGVTSAKRSAEAPQLAAVAEKVPGFVYEGWLGLSAPARTPAAIVERMNRLVRDSLNDPAMKKVLAQLEVAPRAMTPAQTSEFVARDRRHFMEMVRVAGVQRE
ncbi:MAG TPA: tripartite tricarboxylate transporter substrate binding protein [Ramlibacter sp.]|nr:tripartite tricarboxylate transporter substrate binding protein [Ramlibacter sp.]